MSYHLSVLRKILAYSWFAVGAAALYLGYTFYDRYNADQKMTRRTAAKEAEDARKELDVLGSRSLKINQLYAPASLAKGAAGKLCYGVVNAKTVTLEPPVDEMWPALTRCIDIAPKKTTEYTLTAKDASGHSVQQAVTVEVH